MAEVIVALDVPGRDPALELADRLGGAADVFKVGFELFTREGPAIVEALKGRGKRVFLDLKLHDIPNTVAGGVRVAGELGADLLTLHASGGAAMMKAAREASEAAGMRLLAVTVLTSLDAAALAESWGREFLHVEEEVLRLARTARECGLHGVVASPREAAGLRAALGEEAVIVTPGVRPAGSTHGDQARTATPEEAVRAGADFLVVGRAVTRAADPAVALQGILQEVEAAKDMRPR